MGGDEAEPAVWEECRRRQATAEGALAFAPRDLEDVLGVEPEAIVRPSVGVAYVPHPVEPEVDPGVERLRRALQERFDPAGVFA